MKVISAKANAGLDAAKKYLMKSDIDGHLYNAFGWNNWKIECAWLLIRQKQSNYKYIYINFLYKYPWNKYIHFFKCMFNVSKEK